MATGLIFFGAAVLTGFRGDFVEADGDRLAQVHRSALVDRRDADQPVAVAQIFVRCPNFSDPNRRVTRLTPSRAGSVGPGLQNCSVCRAPDVRSRWFPPPANNPRRPADGCVPRAACKMGPAETAETASRKATRYDSPTAGHAAVEVFAWRAALMLRGFRGATRMTARFNRTGSGAARA
jgi:hypothetical protein